MQLSRVLARRAATSSLATVKGRVLPLKHSYNVRSGLVNSDWLSRNLGRGEVKVLDCSWSPAKDHHPQYPEKRVPGARFFNINDCCDKSTDLPHNLPSESQFNSYCESLGLSDSDTVIIYDDTGLTAPRLWWTFRAMSNRTPVAVLDGGLLKWESEGLPLELGPPRGSVSSSIVSSVRFRGECRRSDYAVSIDTVKSRIAAATLGSIQFSTIDARSKGRFCGDEPEPRPIPSGHLPRSCNLPFMNLLHGDRFKEFKGPRDVYAEFVHAGVDLGRNEPLVCSCGSGCTACTLVLGLNLLGFRSPGEVKVYDGSWSEWALDPKHNPILRGCASSCVE